MDEAAAEAPRKRRLNTFGRAMRRARILARIREGWAYDEVAREEGVSRERIRQIVSEVLQKRKVDSGADHARLQLMRLERMMHFTGEALMGGDLKVGWLYLQTLDRLDRYQKVACASEEYDDGARERLLNKINSIAERLGYDKILAENHKAIAAHEAKVREAIARGEIPDVPLTEDGESAEEPEVDASEDQASAWMR